MLRERADVLDPDSDTLPAVAPQERLRALRLRARQDDAEQRAGPGYTPAEAEPTRRRARHRLAERWLPASWLASNVDPGRSGLLAIVLIGLVVACALTFTVWTAQPEAESVPPPPLAAPVLTAPAPTPEALVVSVVGLVPKPGLITLHTGDRVADALQGAGGALPGADISALNLARKVSDGEQLYVGVPPPPELATGSPVGSARGTSGNGNDSKIDLNTATEEQFDELPGVGEVTAKRIVQWRTENGRFASVEQLREVDGIGDTRFSRLRELVRV
ncbi:competence protein ComEA [Saccharopolyspora erythraea NRRL 2338]|uniref:ComEA family DNA-binding protein n=1 Tax=Saccharopolyspora erythraea TaxID=1836 RepID=UPI000C013664|nr:ComEA family DNA-binding protein [Saccharopolyspora erythraea]PFG94544.1 competence protein ComEA [Saccharopolyspora erythraea NRRL 2338]